MVLQIAGGILVLAAVVDVFLTVLFPASGHGIIRPALSKITWELFKLFGRILDGQRRRNFLSYSGPVVILVTFGGWIVALIVGWAMIYKPALGDGIQAASGLTEQDWTTALYYSGYCLSTLGLGDVVSTEGLYRILTIVEATIGFAFFSMAITYFLSVYSNLPHRNAFAHGLHLLANRTGDSAVLLARLANGSDLSDLQQHMTSKAGFLRQTYQTHRFYPVLRYFHYREKFYGLPRLLLTALDTATLLRSAVDPDRYEKLLQHPEIDELVQAALALAGELVQDAEPQPPSDEDRAAWRDRYRDAVKCLSEAGVSTNPDVSAGGELYVSLRSEWAAPLQKVADGMLFQFDDIPDLPENQNAESAIEE